MNIKVGQKLSEVQFYSVEKIVGDKAQLVNDNGENIVVNKDYIDKCLASAHEFSKEEKKNKTELAEIFMSNSRVVMTVCFYKQIKESDVTTEIMKAYEGSTPKTMENAIKKAVKKGLEGEERVMIGRHYGTSDEFGRVNFVDMEVKKDETKAYDTRMRLVDPRTIFCIIVNGVKYTLK